MANSEHNKWVTDKFMEIHVSLETIFEILAKIGFNLVTKKFQDEKADIKVVISASDEDLIITSCI